MITHITVVAIPGRANGHRLTNSVWPPNHLGNLPYGRANSPPRKVPIMDPAPKAGVKMAKTLVRLPLWLISDAMIFPTTGRGLRPTVIGRISFHTVGKRQMVDAGYSPILLQRTICQILVLNPTRRFARRGSMNPRSTVRFLPNRSAALAPNGAATASTIIKTPSPRPAYKPIWDGLTCSEVTMSTRKGNTAV